MEVGTGFKVDKDNPVDKDAVRALMDGFPTVRGGGVVCSSLGGYNLYTLDVKGDGECSHLAA